MAMEVLGTFAMQDEALRTSLIPQLEELTKETLFSFVTRSKASEEACRKGLTKG